MKYEDVALVLAKELVRLNARGSWVEGRQWHELSDGDRWHAVHEAKEYIRFLGFITVDNELLPGKGTRLPPPERAHHFRAYTLYFEDLLNPKVMTPAQYRRETIGEFR